MLLPAGLMLPVLAFELGLPAELALLRMPPIGALALFALRGVEDEGVASVTLF